MRDDGAGTAPPAHAATGLAGSAPAANRAGGTPLDGDQHRALAALLGLQRQSWEQGVAAHALLDLGHDDLVRVMAESAVLRQAPDGRLAEIDGDGIVNSAANVEAVRWLAGAAAGAGTAPDGGTGAGDAAGAGTAPGGGVAAGAGTAPGAGDAAGRAGAALRRQVDWLLHGAPRAADGTLFHLTGTREIWVDSVYMVLPALVVTGHAGAAAGQLAGHRARLFDASARLYAHRWDEATGRLVRGQFWGTGNGWVVAGIARALRLLPWRTGGAAWRDAAAHARDVIDACLPLRTGDGLFHDVVDDPATFVEANLAQMLAYGILTGVADGWLPAGYAEAGRSMVDTARRHLDASGFVRPVCGAPHFDRPGISAEAQAFFLLATAAQRRLGPS